MTFVLEMLALYYLISVAAGVLRCTLRAAILIIRFPVAVVHVVGQHRRKAGALRLHAPSYFLPED